MGIRQQYSPDKPQFQELLATAKTAVAQGSRRNRSRKIRSETSCRTSSAPELAPAATADPSSIYATVVRRAPNVIQSEGSGPYE
jgi:hypothetical protein